ncbi:MAG: substrate-binding domain-containing protein [Caldisericia bacterium]|nr:substrate-binding domain-containing protein [Caldisericia bacterium]
MKTFFLSLGVVLLVLFGFYLYRQPSESPFKNPISETSPLRIGLILRTSTNPLYRNIEEGARLAETALDIRLIVKTGTSETSVMQQIDIVQRCIDENVNAIVITPVGSEILPILKRANDKGIPIVLVENPLQQELLKEYELDHLPFIGIDNEIASQEAAFELAKCLQEPADALIIEGNPFNESSRQRAKGAKDVFSSHPMIRQVYSEYGSYSIETAKKSVEKMMNEHPSIRLIFSINDMMAIGAYQYVKENNRHDIFILSVDGTSFSKDLFEQDEIAVVLDQNAKQQGFEAIRTAEKMTRMDMSSYVRFVQYEILSSIHHLK